jgi:ketosteroid isomerase-like protein
VSDAGAVVERYYGVVADLEASEHALRELLHPDVRLVEHPNAINPPGGVRDLDGIVAGYLAGKEMLRSQSFELHELVVKGDRVAVRATWKGTLAGDVGALPAGAALTAHIGSFLTVVDGRIREHETFDCYEPLPAGDA